MAEELDMTRIPQHIAITMDGNGRWATERNKPRSYGHQAGVDTVRRITSECVRLGVKYKVSERMNVGLEWALHFSLSDELDGQKDPYGIKSSGLFKNTDSHSTLQLTFSYSFMTKCKTCHNEDE